MATSKILNEEDREKIFLDAHDMDCELNGMLLIELTERVVLDKYANWLWLQLMDWCKSRGVAPSQYDSLFEIVTRTRQLSVKEKT